MRLKKIILIVFATLVVIVGVLIGYIYLIAFTSNTSFEEEDFHIYIKTNSDFDEVLLNLEPALVDVNSFKRIAKQKKYIENVKPGHYILKQGMSNNDIISTLRSENIPINIRFNNQDFLEDLAGHISSQIEADSVDLIGVMRDPDFLRTQGLNSENAITMFIPNTYEFYWNTSAIGFRNRMQKENERFWNSDRLKKAENLSLTKEEVMTLASIVQKETAMIDERPRVAGVYLNRLKRGMLLQADPTVIYAIKKEEGDFKKIIRRVLYKDLEIDSPYNTYKYEGLPPGPITMPDISSIDAVLNPEIHDYLFFVADVQKLGYHKFSKSLRQHNNYKAEYVRWLNKQNIRK